MIASGPFAPHRPDLRPAADESTRRQDYRYFHNDGSRLTQRWDEQQRANGPEDEADQRDYDRVQRARLVARNTWTRVVENDTALSSRPSKISSQRERIQRRSAAR